MRILKEHSHLEEQFQASGGMIQRLMEPSIHFDVIKVKHVILPFILKFGSNNRLHVAAKNPSVS